MSAASNPVGVLKRSNLYFVHPTSIKRRPGFNPRFDFGDIEALANSMEANGMLNPIRIKRLANTEYKGDGVAIHFELVDGDRRLTALELMMERGTFDKAFPTGAPALIVDRNQDDVTSLIQMFEANSGKQFLPIEEAAAYQRMRDAGMTIQDICKATGRAQVHVVEVLNLLKADASVKEAVESGEIGKTMAKKIATVAKGDAEAQKDLVEKAKRVQRGDTKARAELDSAMQDVHKKTAAKRGVKLKARLTDAQLSDLGQTISEYVVALLEAEGISPEEDLIAKIKADPMLTIAYSLGSLDAFKVAAGGDNNLMLRDI